MTATPLTALVSGGIAVGFLIVGIILLRFWSRTRDPLFLSFSVAFALMAAGQAAPVVLGIPRESQAGVYLLRLLAFALIIWAIARKNLGHHPRR